MTNTPSSHRWNLPAQVSATAHPAPTTLKGGPSSNSEGIGGWFGGTACKVVPAYLPDGAWGWVPSHRTIVAAALCEKEGGSIRDGKVLSRRMGKVVKEYRYEKSSISKISRFW